MLHATQPGKERVILAGLDAGSNAQLFDVEMDELDALARAAGAEVVGNIVQRRDRIDPATLLGSGKVIELARLAGQVHADAVITLNALRPRQRSALERSLPGVQVMDRTVLILDIFASHARTSEGKLQVELAQLRHRAANLIGSREDLSRLGGGIGTRGPGETKLEVDRRRIRLRIEHLQHQLDAVQVRRREQRRSRAQTPLVALVGYTNAGKSSLLNALSGAKVFVADQPFATLDPTLRKVHVDADHDVILADTVGFISDLPKELVASFRATLEEVTSADLLVHVIDVSNPFWVRQRDSVQAVLRELGADRKPVLYAWNKIDTLPQALSEEVSRFDGAAVSAKTGAGIAALKSGIASRLDSSAPATPSAP
ncbi:MAG TPA: GTPase HflX [Candidatus Eremiobacteraceae bacterium]|nr:GTPase HflX [Candidatus Eremiobacteraceae bacterium]